MGYPWKTAKPNQSTPYVHTSATITTCRPGIPSGIQILPPTTLDATSIANIHSVNYHESRGANSTRICHISHLYLFHLSRVTHAFSLCHVVLIQRFDSIFSLSSLLFHLSIWYNVDLTVQISFEPLHKNFSSKTPDPKIPHFRAVSTHFWERELVGKGLWFLEQKDDFWTILEKFFTSVSLFFSSKCNLYVSFIFFSCFYYFK